MKVAVITGASSGMGRDFARQIAKEERPDELWLIARRAERLEAVARELGVPARVIPLDLTQESDIRRYTDLLREVKPEVTTLVNASGFGKFALTVATPTDDLMGMIDLNVTALTRVTLETLPFMTRGSRIFQLCSLSSFQPVPYLNVYAATKAYVLSFSRALHVELRPRGIRVIAVCPGWVDTEFFGRAVIDPVAVTHYNHMLRSADVVKTALKDDRRRKDVSIHGFPIRMQVLMTKLLPHKWVMAIWMRQQKHS